MRKKRLNLDLEIRKLSKALIKGQYDYEVQNAGECSPGNSDPCRSCNPGIDT